MTAESWDLLKIRLETLRDTVAWLAGASLLVGVLCGYAAVDELRGLDGLPMKWTRYVTAAISGAGIPLIVGSVMLALVVLLTAGMHVVSVSGDEARDDSYADGDESTVD